MTCSRWPGRIHQDQLYRSCMRHACCGKPHLWPHSSGKPHLWPHSSGKPHLWPHLHQRHLHAQAVQVLDHLQACRKPEGSRHQSWWRHACRRPAAAIIGWPPSQVRACHTLPQQQAARLCSPPAAPATTAPGSSPMKPAPITTALCALCSSIHPFTAMLHAAAGAASVGAHAWPSPSQASECQGISAAI
jgi:hypothetical protein